MSLSVEDTLCMCMHMHMYMCMCLNHLNFSVFTARVARPSTLYDMLIA